MTVKNILGVCLLKTGQTNFIEDASYTAEQQAVIDKMLFALNVAYREVVTEYLPLIKEESAMVVNGELFPSALSETLLYPVKLTDENGATNVCRCRPTAIISDFNGTATLTYAYLPDALVLTSSLPDARLTPEILADGVLAELYFEDKVFDLATQYDTDFRTALSLLRYRGREVSVKQRRWGV